MILIALLASQAISQSTYQSSSTTNIASAPTPSICWIDHVEKAGEGVNIYFRDFRMVLLSRGGQRICVAVNVPKVTRWQNSLKCEIGSFVNTELGGELISLQLPNGICSYHVVSKSGMIGVQALSVGCTNPTFNPSQIGAACPQITQFIEAKPR